mgnify:CR=1 FL=1
MTVADLLAACVRRWLVVVVGVTLTIGAAAWIRSIPGVYAAQTDMTLLAPASVRYPNPLGVTSGSLISMAGLVEREVNEGRPVPASVSASVTLVDLGIRQGTEVRLPNSGGQWAYNFARPVLDVEAVGPTQQGVRSAMEAQLTAVRDTVSRLQDEAGVDPHNRITVEASPSAVDVFYRTGHRMIATGMVLLLGAILSVVVAVMVDGRLRHRRGDGRRGWRWKEAPVGSGVERTVERTDNATEETIHA